MTSGKVVLSVLAGIATGAALGVLFAPDKGSSTRKKITKQRDAYIADLNEKVNDLVDSFNKKVETVKREASRMMERGKAKAADLEEELVTVSNSKMR